MKKTVLIGLITLSIGSVAQAVDLDFKDNGSNQWVATNFFLKDTSTPNALPTTADDVYVNAGTSMEISGIGTTGSSRFLRMKQDAVFTIQSGATLNARGLVAAKDSVNYNYGTINTVLSVQISSAGSDMYNYGTINASVDLVAQKGGTFHMMDGIFNGDVISIGSNANKVAALNVHGGTMNFTDTNWFFDSGDANSYYGDLTFDFAGAGTIVFDLDTDTARYNELSVVLADAMTDGYITTDGVADSGATMTLDADNNTITLTAIPEPGTYALLVGCLGLASVMLC
ncbi:MAG: hypothetical protein ACPGES_06355, partial [Coraliomargarita sp.]